MKRYSWYLLPPVLTVLLGACSGPGHRTEPPAPVERGGQSTAPVPPPAPASRSEPAIAAYIPPAEPQIARPEPAKAVQVLARRAEDQERGGDLAGAVSSVERALRIEPRNAALWSQLAGLRERQGRYAMAEELAGKSNSLAGLYERDLKRANWELIARVRRAQGQGEAAREAERQASRFE